MVHACLRAFIVHAFSMKKFTMSKRACLQSKNSVVFIPVHIIVVLSLIS